LFLRKIWRDRRRKRRGKSNKEVHNKIAVIFCIQEKAEKGITYFQQALKIQEKTLGPDHPYVAVTLDNLAVTYGDMGMHKEA